MKVWIQFNKTSGAYVNAFQYVPSEILNHKYFTYAEAEMDLTTQVVIGSVKSWKIYNINELPKKIYEAQLNFICRDKITKEYGLEKQVGILTKVILELVKKAKITGESIDELNEMNSYIEEIRRRNKVLKNSYVSNKSYRYISIEEQNKIEEEMYDGGLHEALGPKNLINEL